MHPTDLKTNISADSFKVRVHWQSLYTKMSVTAARDSPFQSSWSKGIFSTKSKQQSPCSKCMHRPVISQANACTSQACACMYCMHCPVTSQADACSYCMGSVVLILSQIYLYLQLLWVTFVNDLANRNDPLFVAPPKVAKASTIVTVWCHYHWRSLNRLVNQPKPQQFIIIKQCF